MNMNTPECTFIDLLIAVFLTPIFVCGMFDVAEALWNALERFLGERKQRRKRHE